MGKFSKASWPVPRAATVPPAGPVKPADRSGWPWLGAAMIVLAVGLAWSNAFMAPFELDDHASILDNVSIRDLRSLHWLAPPATGGETVSGRPVLNLSLAINHVLGGYDVRGYRAVNVLIHALAGLTLFGLLRRTLARATPSVAGATWFALAAALVWALHPLQTAAVTYVVQRAESLAGLFYLLTLYCFVRTAEPGAAAARWSAAGVVACLLGMATKETMATAPLVVLLYDRAFVSGSLGAAWRTRWRLYTALAATWLLLAALMLVNHGRGGSAGLATPVNPWIYFLTQCWAVPHYLALAVWPRALVFDYGMPVAAGLGAVWPQLLLLVALAAGAGWALWRNRAAGFLGACFFLLLAPSSSFVPVATQTIAEHRMYLALAVPILLLGLAVAGGVRRVPRLAGALVAVVALALGLATFARNRVYGTELSLWQDTVAKRPENPRAHNNLGRALAAAGRTEDAMAEFRRAIELQPDHAFAHFNLAAALLTNNRWEEAASHLNAALAADPAYVSARVNLGQALTQLGRTDEAMAQYRAALALDAGAQDARTNLAALLGGRGQTADAVAMLREVLAATPELAEAHYHLGRALEINGAATDAEGAFREAIRLKPGWADAHLALGNFLAGRGDSAGAEKSYRAAISLDPKSAEAHFALGNVFARQQKFAAAANAYRAALAIDPTHVKARSNLGNCQLMTGNIEEAIATYEQVLRARPDDTAVRRNLELARAQQHPK